MHYHKFFLFVHCLLLMLKLLITYLSGHGYTCLSVTPFSLPPFATHTPRSCNTYNAFEKVLFFYLYFMQVGK